MLEAHRKRVPHARADLVFPADRGEYLDGSALRRRYKKALKHADLRALRFHDLRHTFGSIAIGQDHRPGAGADGPRRRTDHDEVHAPPQPCRRRTAALCVVPPREKAGGKAQAGARQMSDDGSDGLPAARPTQKIASTSEYADFRDAIIERAGAARQRASRAVNTELVLLYWSVGRAILAEQEPPCLGRRCRRAACARPPRTW